MSPSAQRLTSPELLYRILRLSGFCYLLRKVLWRNRAAILYYHDPKPDVMEISTSHILRRCRELWLCPIYGDRFRQRRLPQLQLTTE